jgi:homoserine dehydrogenase
MSSIQVALLGFGNVGRSFAHFIARRNACDRAINIAAVADASAGILLQKPAHMPLLLRRKESGLAICRCSDLGTILPVRDFVACLADFGVTILVEALPTKLNDPQPALLLIELALARALQVVTVDKGPMVHGFRRLAALSRNSSAGLAFSGTTGVCPPPEVRDCRVFEICGILNGTTNYILGEMHRGRPFEEALSQAREKGIAEPDPSLDLLGWDTACKILILAAAYMQAEGNLGDISPIALTPQIGELIREAQASGEVVKFIGRGYARGGQCRITVGPEIVAQGSPLHGVTGTSKGAIFSTVELGDLFATARSGRDAISEVILKDILALADRRIGMLQ